MYNHWKIHFQFFFQGYRVISTDVPQVWNLHEWINSFENFLDSMNIHDVSKDHIIFLLNTCFDKAE
jgi:hypothetical protein